MDLALSALRAGSAHAHFFAGRYEEALTWAKMTLREAPNSHRIATASCALAGRGEEAKSLMAPLLEIDPVLRISKFVQDYLGPYRQAEHPAKWADAPRKAGLPE
jgi:hypothetical protein